MTEKKIDNWIYRVTDAHEYEVIPPVDVRRKKPETLFKYYSLNEHSLEVLEKLEIFTSHPKLLMILLTHMMHLLNLTTKNLSKHF